MKMRYCPVFREFTISIKTNSLRFHRSNNQNVFTKKETKYRFPARYGLQLQRRSHTLPREISLTGNLNMKISLVRFVFLGAMLFTSPLVAQTSITLKTDSVRYVFKDGIGGNFAFGFTRSSTQHSLENLSVANARTEFEPKLWEPENDNGDANTINWTYFKARDTGLVKQRFELMKDFTRRKIPYMVSAWRIPEWMGEVAKVDDRGRVRHRIPAGKMPEVVESIVSFLTYARDNYQTEPEYFSFNEPDLGFYVLFNGTEHKDFILALGPKLKAAGLRTKLALGDVGSTGAIGFTNSAAADPEAVKYIGAVAWHSWGAGTPSQLRAWGDLAEKLKVPLWDTEAGVSGTAYRNPDQIRTYDYAVKDMNVYLEVLLYARPQAIQFWQYSETPGAGYSMLTADSKPTERFGFMRQYAEFIPAGSEALNGEMVEGVHFLAYRHPQKQTLALVFGNTSSTAKKITVRGLPSGVKSLVAVRTSQGAIFQTIQAPSISGDAITVDVPARSLTTVRASYGAGTAILRVAQAKGRNQARLLISQGGIPGITQGAFPLFVPASEGFGYRIFDSRGKRMNVQKTEAR